MTIPKTIKVGGTVYRICVTDQLYNHNECYGEMNLADQIIRIRPCGEDTMCVTLMHEILHAVNYFLGYTEHNEKQIDELANAIYMVIKDNPKIFENNKK